MEKNMPSFDVVSEVNKVELANSLEQANKEITNRFDFKGSDARIELKELELTVYADDDFKLSQVREVMVAKMTKRGIDTRVLEDGKKEKISGNKLKEIITVKNGISQDLGKKIVKLITKKHSKNKAKLRKLLYNGTRDLDLHCIGNIIEYIYKL